MKVVDVRLHLAPMAGNWLTERTIANPMSAWPRYRGRRDSWMGRMTAGVVEVIAEDGTHGLGFVGGGRARATAPILEDHLRDLVIGCDPLETTRIQQQLFRASIAYGLGGIAQDLISGIDLALWDLKGRLLGVPVYDLLGGRAVDALRPYLTSWDAAALDRWGIRDVKIAIPHGPADGEAGMRANEEAVRAVREAIGPDGFIALDCYMAWDVPYTIEMASRLADYGIAWIEEPVLPDQTDAYRRIRDRVHCRVTGGEHVFTLEGFRRLIVDGGIDIVQPDIYRAGGITALRDVAALARAYGRQLICHGVGAATYHFLAANGPDVSPRCEFLDIRAGGTATWVLTADPEPRAGTIDLPSAPGFGYELDTDAFAPGAVVATIW